MVRTSLGLQLGGAAGNLVDRITLGKVTDFIDVGAWPVFNLADASIVTGIVILAWLLFRSPKAKPVAEDAGGTGNGSGTLNQSQSQSMADQLRPSQRPLRDPGVQPSGRFR